MTHLSALLKSLQPHRLFGSALRGEPHVFDFSPDNPAVALWDTAHFAPFQEAVYGELEQSGKSWGIGRYLEDRSGLLHSYPQIIDEGRVIHAGLDITALPGTALFAPLNSEVIEAGKEEGLGNYGGYVLLRHCLGSEQFYSFYGHLCSRHRVTQGQKLLAGASFAVIGEAEDSGGWFTHTHLQMLTEKAMEQGRMLQGYITQEDLAKVDELFPSPHLLFRY
ncbi:MAG: peptidoglycan DD-metalloendopeptidase family protein [Candidatus Peregrinibacteria bacterium]